MNNFDKLLNEALDGLHGIESYCVADFARSKNPELDLADAIRKCIEDVNQKCSTLKNAKDTVKAAICKNPIGLSKVDILDHSKIVSGTGAIAYINGAGLLKTIQAPIDDDIPIWEWANTTLLHIINDHLVSQ